ncbi:MAG: alanine--glyoxylate aminotransferase family protein, partial [Lachnospiraceae bacterium]
EGVMFAGSFDFLAGKVIRIGHMGENAREEKVADALRILGKVLGDLHVSLHADLEQVFLSELSAS